LAPGRVKTKLLGLGCTAALLCALLAAVLSGAPRAGAADRAALEGKLAGAREEAGSIAVGLQESKAELGAAEAETAKAEAHEERLSALLGEGEAREAELSAKVAATRRHLAAEKARLRRARAALAARLVAIYESGTPDTATLIFGSADYQELQTQADYLRQISESDTALASRVGEVRDDVDREVTVVAALRRRAIAYDERLAAARAEIAAVREAAAASAAHLAAVADEREAALGTLKGDISQWIGEVEEIKAQEAREARERAASEAEAEAEAEEEIGRWLGGPYTIPTYIVMCESGGDYGAVNPSSGAGGAYQILPSTWELYGGQGEPQNAPKAEQDQIASEIWADSGSSAWVCGSL
jgi:septal ring factor EnvC (AmiA/AmiB activator)